MKFEQAGIAVQKAAEYEALRGALESALAPGAIDSFFKRMDSNGLAVRQFEKALEKKLFEAVDPELKKSGRSAQELYQALTPSDQGLIREFYLVAIETVPMATRQKFYRIYGYY